ncbi:MAG: recombinase family protein, partial [Pseudomonadota bacterium]
MEKWGYVRVSVNRDEQAAGWEDQITKLKAIGCDRFFYEEASTRSNRPEFLRMMTDAYMVARSDHRICLVAA